MQVVVSHRTACKAAEVVACCRTPILSAALPPPARRPRRLLVFVNPFGGARRGKKIWDTVVRPVFDKAGIKCTAVETQHGGHARALLTSECWGADEQVCREQERCSSLPLCGGGNVCLLGPKSLLHAGVCYSVALVQSSLSLLPFEDLGVVQHGLFVCQTAGMPSDELAGYDGVVAIGGDGCAYLTALLLLASGSRACCRHRHWA